MTPEQVALMQKIAKQTSDTARSLAKHIRECDAKKLEVIGVASDERVFEHEKTGTPPTMEIENKFQGGVFKFDVTFRGSEKLPKDERLEHARRFLVDVQSIFSRYGVSMLHGHYEPLTNNHGPV